MSRRWLVLLIIPALALFAWALAEQLPRWLAPQPDWFAPGTPAVCVAVDTLRLYSTQRINSLGAMGSTAARAAAERIIAQHYDSPAVRISEPLEITAALPGEMRRLHYLVTAELPDAATVILLSAQSGEALAVITTPLTDTVTCDFDTRAALVAAVRSPPVILLAAYTVLTTAALIGWRLLQAKGKRS